MKFIDVYNKIIVFFPQEIDISEGEPTENGGFYSETLDNIFEEIKNKVGIKNPWNELMVWCISTVVHSNAKSAFKNQNYLINTRDIDKHKVEEIYFEIIMYEDSGFKVLLNDYERIVE